MAARMVVLSLTCHPRGLPPEQTARAWSLRAKQKYRWSQIQEEVVNLQGEQPSETCLRIAVLRMFFHKVTAKGSDFKSKHH